MRRSRFSRARYVPSRRVARPQQRNRRYFIGGKPVDLVPYGALRTSVTTGPFMRFVGTSTPDIVSRLVRLSDLVSPPATGAAGVALADAFGRRWTDPLSEPGAGEIRLLNTDANLASIVGDGNDLVTMYYRGQAAWTMMLEDFERARVAQGEEHDQLTLWSGRGHLALLERMVVYPTRGVGQKPIEEDRQFNWTSPVYDDSTWGLAAFMQWMFIAQGFGGWPLPWDSGFPDGFAAIMGPPGGTISVAPLGHNYFRQTFVVPVDGRYKLWAASDNPGEVYVDGQLVLSHTHFNEGETGAIELDLSAGTHLIAAHVENLTINSPTGFAWTLYSTNGSGEAVALVDHSGGSMKCVAYPIAIPGMTPGEVMRLVLEEAQLRGSSLAGNITRMFDDLFDSAGNPWPNAADIATRVGTDYLTFFREMAGTYIDMWMDPTTLRFYAWNIGTRTSVSGVTLVPAGTTRWQSRDVLAEYAGYNPTINVALGGWTYLGLYGLDEKWLRYNIARNELEVLTPPPDPIIAEFDTYAAIDGAIYIFDELATYRYDPATDTWSTTAVIPTYRTQAAVAVVGSRAYVAGGYGNVSEEDVLEIFDASDNTWSTGASLPRALAELNATVVSERASATPANHIFAFGAWDPAGSGAYIPTALEYVVETDTWTELPTPPYDTNVAGAPIVENILGATNVLMSNTLILVALGYGDAQSARSYLYRPATDVWTEIDAAPFNSYAYSSRVGHQILVLRDGGTTTAVWPHPGNVSGYTTRGET